MKFCLIFFVLSFHCFMINNCDELLRVYPSKKTNIANIATIEYKAPSDNKTKTQNLETVLILDISGSMGSSVNRIITRVLPLFFKKLNYSDSARINLITFETSAQYFNMTVKEFQTSNIKDLGSTHINPAIQKLRDFTETFKLNNVDAIRILTISDGDVGDIIDASKTAEALAFFLKSLPISINSQGIRWESSNADTRALSGLVNLNNVNKPRMIDSKVSHSDDKIAESWADLFKDDNLTEYFISIRSNEKIFLKSPWDKNPIDKLPLIDGKNIFWITNITKDIRIDKMPVNIDEKQNVTYRMIYDILKDKFYDIVAQIKNLKIMNTTQAFENVEEIVNYFKKLETEVPPPNGTKKISEVFEEIAKDNKTFTMNSQQLADYLKVNDEIVFEEPPTKSTPTIKNTTITPNAEKLKMKVNETSFFITPQGIATVAVGSFVATGAIFGLVAGLAALIG
ncbi:hypothetical protein PVAND_016430 [Polypedilum vanderplanki]|uniref:VWFA domain-containing protein n=1 Tax=Polypedilum vanderplanki TaxID=319348 RepID=A0A9J6BG71_POLVA|nr:hypothetical protein PVAND_016430 [Polypedilum vanderplanki]